jgi:peptidoglycan glycosyltransferase
MAPQVRALGTFVLATFAVLAGFAGYWQAIAAPSLSATPQNPRLFQDDRRALRGRILDWQGNVLVESRPDGSRRLTVPSLGHVVGYRSARYGTTGVELAEDAALSGTGGPLSMDDLLRQVAQLPGRGADVRLCSRPQRWRWARQVARSWCLTPAPAQSLRWRATR